MFGWQPWPSFAAAVGSALVLAVAVAAIVTIPVRLIARRAGWDRRLIGKIRRPFRAVLLVVGLWIAVAASYPDKVWQLRLEHGLLIATIAASAWLVGGLLDFAFARALARYPTDVVDNRVARRVHTQISVLRRVLVVVIVILAMGAILLTFPGVQAVGTSVLASAGVVSVIAGLAAQSTLGNVFAGIQLAFSGAIRVDDVVVVVGEWGRIEDITLTYVVVRIWDERRMVLPSTYFTTTPFENWTRRSSQVTGAVEFDLDWRLSTSAMRRELDRILARTDSWDGRVKVLQVTDAVGGRIHIRVLVSAKDAPTLWDLRCSVRERLVDWLQHEQPHALPLQRVELGEATLPPRRGKAPADEPEGLFTGSPQAQQRADEFTAPVPVQPSDDSGDPGRADD
jgi:small-conductance mechanosensitive channel